MRDIGLVVFAKAPLPGRVKTRLVGPPPGLLAEQAAALHAAFVRDVCAHGAQAGFGRRRLYVAGDGPELRTDPRTDSRPDPRTDPRLVDIAREHGFELRLQEGADLGARMSAALLREVDEGAAGVVLIGTDSPTLPVAYLGQAGARLGAAEPAAGAFVLGPALDGGYYLIGARRAPGLRPALERLLVQELLWSTDQVLPETLRRLCALGREGCAVHLLPPFYDVDTPADLAVLVADLTAGRTEAGDAPHTCALLTELGLLRPTGG